MTTGVTFQLEESMKAEKRKKGNGNKRNNICCILKVIHEKHLKDRRSRWGTHAPPAPHRDKHVHVKFLDMEAIDMESRVHTE